MGTLAGAFQLIPSLTVAGIASKVIPTSLLTISFTFHTFINIIAINSIFSQLVTSFAHAFIATLSVFTGRGVRIAAAKTFLTFINILGYITERKEKVMFIRNVLHDSKSIMYVFVHMCKMANYNKK
jgi:hypothetical protein